MATLSSESINADIFNWGPSLFCAVRQAVLEEATFCPSHDLHERNKSLLLAAIEQVLDEAASPKDELDANAMWQAIWPRIVYAGTRASKASAEIASMRQLVPWFRDLRNFSPGTFMFDEAEWSTWKSMDSEKRPDPERHFVRTTREIWSLLNKDHQTFPSLRFSAWDKKVSKYIAVSNLLWPDLADPNANALHRFTGGIVFTPTHKIGDEWIEERNKLAEVQGRFAKELGPLTALHTMMDLGLKTIKPDRVMTRLFSELGWLITLPKETPALGFEKLYLRKAVIEEMTVRADVLAKALVDSGVLARSGLGDSQAHRLIDIWFVKYGQEPDSEFGISCNLSVTKPIAGLLSAIKSGAAEHSNVFITPGKAKKLWPWQKKLMPVRTMRPPTTSLPTSTPSRCHHYQGRRKANSGST